jgi:cobalt/nickel transport system permease protein
MPMRVETFSEFYSGGDGLVRRMDTRVKLAFAGACLLLAVVSSGPSTPLVVGAVCLSLLIAAGTPARAVALRMAEPVVFAVIVALLQAVITRGEPVISRELFGITLSVSAEGLAKGAIIVSRVFGAVTAVLFLTMTTPTHRLLSAAARLRAPRSLVEISLFAYRYIFVLIEDAITVYHAQRGRLGYSGISRGLRSIAALAGSVLLRAYDQAEATGESMALRGYTGEYIPSFNERFRARDGLLLGVIFTLCLVVGKWIS